VGASYVGVTGLGEPRSVTGDELEDPHGFWWGFKSSRKPELWLEAAPQQAPTLTTGGGIRIGIRTRQQKKSRTNIQDSQ